MIPSRGAVTRLAAVWFADIVGYSRLASHDEKAALGLVDVLRSTLSDTLQEHGGRLVKHMGDGALAEFASADTAVRAALDLERRFAERAGALVPAVRLRVGVHVGEVTPGPDGDLYGDGVNTAARLQQSAEPGEVVVSEDVWRSLRQRSDHRFTSLGQRTLKGLAVPVRVFQVEAAGAAPRPEDHAIGWLRRTVRRRTVAYAAVGSLAVLAGYGLLARGPAPGDPVSASEGIPSLAVLPLANLNPDPESEYFADGMTEELISALSRVEGLRVVSRTSAFAFKGRRVDVREVGEMLGVGSVLEGSVRSAGDHLRVTVQLVDTRDGYQLWSDTYDRELADVFAIQEEISQAVVRALASRLGAGGSVASRRPLARRGTDDLEAYDLYLQGRYLTNKWSDESVRRGIGYFERAIERDRDFARAWAGLADAYMWLLWDGSVEEALPPARESARRALELDDSLSEAHYAIARITSEIDWDWPTAEAEFRRALALDPTNGEAHHRFAHLLLVLGRYAEATAESRRLIELDPLNAEWHHHLGWNYLFSRRYDRAEAPYRKALELDPNLRAGRGYLGVLYVKQERFPDAMAMFLEAIERDGSNGETLSHLAWGHAMTGDRAAARAILAQIDREAIPVPAWRRAYVHAALDERDQAFEWLERAFAERRAIFQFAKDPRFDPLQDDPRFAQMIRRMNLAP